MTPTVAAQSVKRVLNSTEPRSFDPHRAMTGGMRKTKIVSTIGPTSNTKDVFFKLADCGINVVRLNMSHGDHNSHMDVVKLVREYNAVRDNNLAIMLDTKGPEIRSGDVVKPLQLETGDTLIFTIDEASAGGGDNRVSVNYDGFISDCSVSDIVLVDGGLLSMEVKEISGSDLICSVIDGGSMGSRRHLNVRGKSANLPAITEKDWDDIKFGIQAGVDYFALSFVRDADVIHELRRYLIEEAGQDEDSRIQILAKIESADSVNHLEEILDAVDGAMVARGDLGAELPVEEVPYWQNRIVQGCRARGKPCIVATNMYVSIVHQYDELALDYMLTNSMYTMQA
jgi:pyruvate kinase